MYVLEQIFRIKIYTTLKGNQNCFTVTDIRMSIWYYPPVSTDILKATSVGSYIGSMRHNSSKGKLLIFGIEQRKWKTQYTLYPLIAWLDIKYIYNLR